MAKGLSPAYCAKPPCLSDPALGTVIMPLRGTTKDPNLAASGALPAEQGRAIVISAGNEVEATVALRA